MELEMKLVQNPFGCSHMRNQAVLPSYSRHLEQSGLELMASHVPVRFPPGLAKTSLLELAVCK